MLTQLQFKLSLAQLNHPLTVEKQSNVLVFWTKSDKFSTISQIAELPLQL